jgi:hypothetical protein
MYMFSPLQSQVGRKNGYDREELGPSGARASTTSFEANRVTGDNDDAALAGVAPCRGQWCFQAVKLFRAC